MYRGFHFGPSLSLLYAYIFGSAGDPKTAPPLALAQQYLDLRLLGGALVGLAVGRGSQLIGAMVEQHLHASSVSLPDGGQNRCDAVLVHLLSVCARTNKHNCTFKAWT